MHLAQLLPDNDRDAKAVLNLVQELHGWAENKAPATVLAFSRQRPKGLAHRIFGGRRVSAAAAISAAITAFAAGYMMDPDYSDARHRCNGIDQMSMLALPTIP